MPDTESPAAMIVRCPRCSARYLLPERLMGAAGARVRCPGCGERFEVAREAGDAEAGESTAAAPEPARPVAAADAAPGGGAEWMRAVAREVVERLAARSPGLGESHARGRLFSEAGPALLEAFDEYRRRAGAEADVAPFREALRERWNIDLGPAGDSPAPGSPPA